MADGQQEEQQRQVHKAKGPGWFLVVTLLLTIGAIASGVYLAAVRPRLAYDHHARQALDALHALDSVVSAGVIYQDYVRRVADTRIAVDAFERKCPEHTASETSGFIGLAMAEYELAAAKWQEQFDTEGYAEQSLKHQVQTLWRAASEHIDDAENALQAAAGKQHDMQQLEKAARLIRELQELEKPGRSK